MSIRVDETKPDIEATEPAIPTTCSPEDLPDEELLYDLADLFKVFSDTTRIKILYALMGRELCVADIAEATETSQSAVSHQSHFVCSPEAFPPQTVFSLCLQY